MRIPACLKARVSSFCVSFYYWQNHANKTQLKQSFYGTLWDPIYLSAPCQLRKSLICTSSSFQNSNLFRPTSGSLALHIDYTLWSLWNQWFQTLIGSLCNTRCYRRYIYHYALLLSYLTLFWWTQTDGIHLLTSHQEEFRVHLNWFLV